MPLGTPRALVVGRKGIREKAEFPHTSIQSAEKANGLRTESIIIIPTENVDLKLMTEELWIAGVHLKPKSRNSALSKRAKGAYANAVAFASGLHNLEIKLRKEADAYGLSIVEIEDAEPFERWAESHNIPDELQALVDSIEAAHEVRFDAFRQYLADDEIQ